MFEAGLVLFRFLHFAACFFMFGASGFCIALRRMPDAQDSRQGLRVAFRFSAIAAVVTALLWFQCVAGMMTGNPSAAADPTVLQTVLFKTSFGQIWFWRVLLALTIAILAFRAMPELRLHTLVLSGFLLASLSLTGHAAMEEGFRGIGHRVADAIHLLSGGYWVGAVAALPFVLGPSRSSDLTYRVLRRFSDLGVIAVTLVVASGLLNAFFMVQAWSQILHFAYGKILLVKLSLVLMMVIVACANRFILLPTLREGHSSLRSLRGNVLIEILVGALVLLAASLLGTVSPPMPPTM